MILLVRKVLPAPVGLHDCQLTTFHFAFSVFWIPFLLTVMALTNEELAKACIEPDESTKVIAITIDIVCLYYSILLL